MHIAQTIAIPCTTEARLTGALAARAQIAGIIAVVASIACMFGAAAYTSIDNAQQQAAVWRSQH